MRSPGAMMAVVNTPDSIPAANSCGYLQGVDTHTHRVTQTARAGPGHRRRQRGLRQNIVGGFLLQLLAESEPEKADGKHGRDPHDGSRHASVEPLHPLRERRDERGQNIEARMTRGKLPSSRRPHLFAQGLLETVDGPGVQRALSRFGFGLSL